MSLRTRLLLATVLVAAVPIASSATLYKWVDDQGVVHYSDQPEPGAEKIKVKPAQSYKGGTPRVASAPASASPPTAGQPVSHLAIESPTPEQVFINQTGVAVVADVQPGLQSGQQVVFLLDGTPVEGLGPESTSVTLDQVPRGTHNVAVQVLDERGRVVATSSSVTFYVREPTLNRAPKGPSITPH
jgi:hypothetical protein